jgi:hypothetical protein
LAIVNESGKWEILRVVTKGDEEKVTIQTSRVANGAMESLEGWQFAVAHGELVRCNGRRIVIVREGRGSLVEDVALKSSQISGELLSNF